MRHIFSIFAIILFFVGCSTKAPSPKSSLLILFKTPYFKFHDHGFISHYDNHHELELYSGAKLIKKLQIYKDKVCISLFKCQDSLEFNKEFLGNNYNREFLYTLFSKKRPIKYRDKNILIKVSEL
jgi:hypothetical protein